MGILDANSIFEKDKVSQAMVDGIKEKIRKELTAEFMDIAEQHVKGIVDNLILNFDAWPLYERKCIMASELIVADKMLQECVDIQNLLTLGWIIVVSKNEVITPYLKYRNELGEVLILRRDNELVMCATYSANVEVSKETFETTEYKLIVDK